MVRKEEEKMFCIKKVEVGQTERKKTREAAPDYFLLTNSLGYMNTNSCGLGWLSFQKSCHFKSGFPVG